MPSIRVFEPARCCNTEACGPDAETGPVARTPPQAIHENVKC
ncbi:arsenic metallochaperone ArsD family protein [Cutibacterium avidum]|nr:arsenic metallochaperone ArsD family protein [Cutibacterium avidum]